MQRNTKSYIQFHQLRLFSHRCNHIFFVAYIVIHTFMFISPLQHTILCGSVESLKGQQRGYGTDESLEILSAEESL